MRYKLISDEPGTDAPVLTIENDHCQSLSVKIQGGTLYADAETAEVGGYAAVYLRFVPDNCEEGVDIARLKEIPGTNDIELSVWEEPDMEDPTSSIRFDAGQIAEQINGEDDTESTAPT